MVKVQRLNVILTIPDDAIDVYLNKGYNVIDSAGNVLKAAVPRDPVALQHAYTEHTKKIAELEDTIAKLTAELMQAQKAEKPAKKTTAKK